MHLHKKEKLEVLINDHFIRDAISDRASQTWQPNRLAFNTDIVNASETNNKCE